MTQFYTYLHCKPDLTPFYVGKGCGSRSHEFVHNRNKHHRNTIAIHGSDNIIVLVFKKDSEESAFASEKRLIKMLRNAGFKLCNQSDGGEGPSGAQRSPETRAKISLAKKNPSDETRANLAAAQTGKKHSVEHKAKIAMVGRGRKHTPETLAKMSVAQRGNKNNLGNTRSEETRSKMSISMKKTLAKKRAIVVFN